MWLWTRSNAFWIEFHWMKLSTLLILGVEIYGYEFFSFFLNGHWAWACKWTVRVQCIRVSELYLMHRLFFLFVISSSIQLSLSYAPSMLIVMVFEILCKSIYLACVATMIIICILWMSLNTHTDRRMSRSMPHALMATMDKWRKWENRESIQVNSWSLFVN